jgi:hypothetical protein
VQFYTKKRICIWTDVDFFVLRYNLNNRNRFLWNIASQTSRGKCKNILRDLTLYSITSRIFISVDISNLKMN